MYIVHVTIARFVRSVKIKISGSLGKIFEEFPGSAKYEFHDFAE